MVNTGGTRRRLIDVSRRMIDADGVDAVSMRELGTAMGLSRSAVYRHFDNKDDLLAAIATEDFTWLTDALTALQHESTEPRQLVRKVLGAFYDFAVDHHERFGLMFIRRWEPQGYEALHTAARELFAVVYRTMEQACGLPPRGRSPRQLTAMSAAFVTGLAELNRAGHLAPEKGFDDPSGLIDAFFDAISA